MEKVEVLVRFANEGVYYNTIKIDPSKISDLMFFPNKLFFNIDGKPVEIKKEDWEKIEQWGETGKEN